MNCGTYRGAIAVSDLARTTYCVPLLDGETEIRACFRTHPRRINSKPRAIARVKSKSGAQSAD
jgi:hypothetical protein